MGIQYVNLDDLTRGYMLKEFQMGGYYISPRLTGEGKVAWPTMLQEAIERNNDDWLAREILDSGYILSQEQFNRDGVTRSRRINLSHAAQQLAEGEFNRYYIRGLCSRAKEEGKNSLIVYRGKHVSQPRPESERKIGSAISADMLLETLRTNDFVTIEDAFGVPGGPNSGLTCRLS